jgi:hypothetical protein
MFEKPSKTDFFHFLGICFACDNISVFLDRLDLVSRSLNRSRRDKKRRAAGLQRSRPGNAFHSCHNVFLLLFSLFKTVTDTLMKTQG